MASSATVGTAVIKLSFDGKGVKAQLDAATDGLESTGKTSGGRFGDAFTIAAGHIMAKGFTKVMSTITNQIDDAVLRADTLERFPKVMEQMGYSAGEASDTIQKLMKGVEQIPTPLNEVVSGTQRLVSVTHDVEQASDWIMAISDAMLANGASASRASDATEQFLQVVSRGKPMGQDWLTIMEVAPGVMEELAKSLGYASAALGGDMYTALQKGELSMEDFMGALVKMDQQGTDSFGALSEVARTATGGIETTLTTMKQSISNAIVSIIQEIGAENITDAINGIKEALVGVVKTVGTVVKFIQTNWTWLQPIFTGILSFLGAVTAIFAAKKVFMGMQALFSLASANPIILILAAVSAAVLLLITHWDEFKASVEAVFSAITETISNFGAWIGETFQGIWDTVTGIFSALADFFGNIFGGAWERVKAVFSTGGQIFMGIVDGITNAFKTIVNAIINGINRVVAIPFNAINGFLDTLRSVNILGLEPFGWIGQITVPQIPTLAQGGFVDGATTALIGEAGREAVLPLDRNTDNWAGLLASTLAEEMQTQGKGSTINVYMTNEINNKLDAAEIGRIMMESIRRSA